MQGTGIRNCLSRSAGHFFDHLEKNGWELLERRSNDGAISSLNLKRDDVNVTIVLTDGTRLAMAVVSTKFPERSVIDVAQTGGPKEVTDILDGWVADLAVMLQ